MAQLLQLIVGLVLGVVALWWMGWLGASPGNRVRRDLNDDKVYAEQLTKDDIEGGIGIHPKLVEYSSNDDANWDGQMKIIKVTDIAYVAFGVSYANVIILDGPEGLILVDTSESPKTAKLVLVALRKMNKKPIKAIVLSHFHLDHIQGVDIFIEDKANPPDIWGFHTLPDIIKANLAFGPKSYRGVVHQFGFQLSGKSGISWPRIPYGLIPIAPHFPNRLIRNEFEHAQIAGLNVTFVHIPGETDDEIAVWLPDTRVLMPGDDIYKAFPNLYAIRGTPPRDAVVWARSLRLMRSLNADFLIPAHLLPVTGRQEIYDLLTVYSSAIQYVHDQTVRRLNELRHPDEIGRMVRLPPSLASHPYLGEFYGGVEWAAKGVYQRYVGWFSGDPAELFPLTPSERSQAMVDLIGIDRMLDEADVALRSGRTQWSMELSGHVRRVQPDCLRARWLWMQSLRQRAGEQSNPVARNYYLTAALDSYGLVDWRIDREALIDDVAAVIQVMKYRLKAELTDGVNSTIRLHFTDTGATFRLQILYCVLEVEALTTGTAADQYSDPTIVTTEPVWLDILVGKIQAAAAFTSGDVKVIGSLPVVRQFLSYF